MQVEGPLVPQKEHIMKKVAILLTLLSLFSNSYAQDILMAGYTPSISYNISETEVLCADCNTYLGYAGSDNKQNSIMEFKIQSHLLSRQNDVFYCAYCNSPLFSIDDLTSSDKTWLVFSAPISEDRINFNYSKIFADNERKGYCSNCGGQQLINDTFGLSFSIKSVAVLFKRRK